MKGKREQYLVPALSFAIPAAVMLWVYASLGIAPFGDNTVLVSDMSSQYVDFFCALKHGDLFFSWSKALGTGYIGVISYYVSSPLSLLTLLVPNEAMPVGLALLTVLKIGLAGLSFSIFAQRRFPGCGTAALICAVCYALMSYNAAYSLCIMWLDGVIWLPLILLALERVLAGRGAGPYIAALTVCFISTWYISYMVGIFCVLYLGVRLAGLRPDRKALAGILGRFFGGAACALGLTAWMWMPTFLAMFSGKFDGAGLAGYGNLDYGNLVLCNPVLLLGQLLPGRFGGIDNSAMPYIFCGTAAWVLALAHFLCWDSYQWEKVAERGVLLVLFLSMLFSPLDKIWHVFRMPNWFPFRYAFLFSFFLLYLALQAMPRALEALKKRGGRRLARGAALVLAVFTVAEMGMNARSIASGMQERYGSDSYQSYRDSCTAGARLVEASKLDAGLRFARVGSTADRGHNNPLALGYPGITHYSSLYHSGVNRLLKELGFAQSWYWCSYRGSTPVTDAVLDIGWVIGRSAPDYTPLAQAGGLTLWKNPDTLPLAFLAAECADGLAGAGPFERQNNLLGGILGREAEAFSPAAAGTDSGSGETVFTLVGEGRPIYADLSAGGLTQVLVNGERVLSLDGDMSARVQCLGAPAPGEGWTVTVLHPGTFWEGTLWSFDRGVLHQAVEQMNNVEVTSVDRNGRVRLTASPRGDETLVTTIPAENGWTAYVDGEKAEMGTWLGTFLALELPPGTHEVELRYTAPGLLPGIALGAASLAGLALALARRRRRQ